MCILQAVVPDCEIQDPLDGDNSFRRLSKNWSSPDKFVVKSELGRVVHLWLWQTCCSFIKRCRLFRQILRRHGICFGIWNSSHSGCRWFRYIQRRLWFTTLLSFLCYPSFCTVLNSRQLFVLHNDRRLGSWSRSSSMSSFILSKSAKRALIMISSSLVPLELPNRSLALPTSICRSLK